MFTMLLGCKSTMFKKWFKLQIAPCRHSHAGWSAKASKSLKLKMACSRLVISLTKCLSATVMNSRTGEMASYETKSTKQESNKNINLGLGMQRDCEQNDQEAKKAMAVNSHTDAIAWSKSSKPKCSQNGQKISCAFVILSADIFRNYLVFSFPFVFAHWQYKFHSIHI